MSNKKKWWFTSPSRNCLPPVSSPLCALFVARTTSAVENNSRYMTFRQVHRSGEHWNFLIIVFIAAEPCKFGTAPAPSRENYPGSGSGSGSEQNVPAAPAPAPVPDKVCRFRRLRIPAPNPCYIAVQKLFTSSVPPLCRVRGPANICRTQFDV